MRVDLAPPNTGAALPVLLSCRDRAKERREGVNIDFVDPEQELAARGLAPNALQHLSIEQSKFLGGDIAHTHLVKGLDYALLHQVGCGNAIKHPKQFEQQWQQGIPQHGLFSKSECSLRVSSRRASLSHARANSNSRTACCSRRQLLY